MNHFRLFFRLQFLLLVLKDSLTVVIYKKVPLEQTLYAIQHKCFEVTYFDESKKCTDDGTFEGIGALTSIVPKYITAIKNTYRKRTEEQIESITVSFQCNFFDETLNVEKIFNKDYEIQMKITKDQLVNPINTKAELTNKIEELVQNQTNVHKSMKDLISETKKNLEKQAKLFPERNDLMKNIDILQGQLDVINYYQKETPRDNEDAIVDLYFREKDERVLQQTLEDKVSRKTDVNDEISKIKLYMRQLDEIYKEGKFTPDDITKKINELFDKQEAELDSFWIAQNYVEVRSYRYFDLKFKQFTLMKGQIIQELYKRGSNLGQCRLINKKQKESNSDNQIMEGSSVFREVRRNLKEKNQRKFEMEISSD